LSIYCLQRLIDGVTAYASDGTDITQAAMWGLLYVFLLGSGQIFWLVQPKMGRYMNRRLRNTLPPVVIKKFTDIEYHNFEEQHFQDVAARVGNRPQQYIIYSIYFNILFFIQDAINLIGILRLFFAASLWIGIGAALIGIPADADIVFDNVSFAYPNTEREVLHNVSFRINSREKAAIVGVNGAGKSTIIKLLCGLYRPDSGHIRIGGKDIAALSQDDVRQAVSVVFQDYGCYQLTLRENIAFGDLTALNDDERLSEALKRAGADEILEKGLDVPLGRLYEGGIDISKGQWQRIAVARAFLSKSNFVILDEPTASLDPIAESRMYGAFSEILKERGTIIISHRLASAKMADKIIVIEGGEVAAVGNHAELMKEGGLYAAMFEEQSSWYQGDAAQGGEVPA